MKEFLKVLNSLAMECVVKVLKVDLDTNTYKTLYIDKGESTISSPFLNDWIKSNHKKELIHPDYSEAFENIFSVESLKKSLKYKKYLHYRFLRMPNVNMEYRNTVITALPAEEHSCYLIIYDIEDC